MRLNADFSKRIVVRPEDYRWIDSPMPGVERMMLDRIGGEVARATSLVRYAPGSTFSRHVHGGGEEFFVLEGEFADEHQAYPAGSYVRNPIGTAHSPRVGPQGCVIFVKLHQFSREDDRQLVIDTLAADWTRGREPGLELMVLHAFDSEIIALHRLAPDTRFESHTHHGGAETLVLEGRYYDEHGTYPAGSWIRSPHQSEHAPYTREEGATLWIKTGHLASAA